MKKNYLFSNQIKFSKKIMLKNFKYYSLIENSLLLLLKNAKKIFSSNFRINN